MKVGEIIDGWEILRLHKSSLVGTASTYSACYGKPDTREYYDMTCKHLACQKEERVSLATTVPRCCYTCEPEWICPTCNRSEFD